MVVFLGWLGYLGWKFTLDDVPMISRLMSRRFSHDFSVFQVAFVHDVTARHWHLRWRPKWAERNRIAISKEIEKLNAMLKSRMADLQLIGGIPTYPGYPPQKYEWVRLDHHPYWGSHKSPWFQSPTREFPASFLGVHPLHLDILAVLSEGADQIPMVKGEPPWAINLLDLEL